MKPLAYLILALLVVAVLFLMALARAVANVLAAVALSEAMRPAHSPRPHHRIWRAP